MEHLPEHPCSNVQKLKLRDDAPNALNISDPSCRLPPDALEGLWLAMIALYGNKWASSFGSAPGVIATDVWGGGLFGFTQRQIEEGLEACVTRDDDWPPSLPEFRALCLGIPAFARVRMEIEGADKNRSPFTRLVWTFVSSYALRNATTEKAERLLREAYELAKESRMRGAPLPAAPELVEQQQNPTRRGANPEHVARCFDEINGLLAGVASTPDPERREHKPAPMSDDARALANQLDRFERQHAPIGAMEDWP